MRKEVWECNKCHKQLDIKYSNITLRPVFPSKWLIVADNYHLCESCSVEARAMQERHNKERKRICGV